MSNVYLDDSLLTGIGNAIRTKAGTSGLLTPAQMATAIANIPTGGGGATRACGGCGSFIGYRTNASNNLNLRVYFPAAYGLNIVNSDYDDYFVLFQFKNSSASDSYTITFGDLTPDYQYNQAPQTISTINSCKVRINAWKLKRLYDAVKGTTFQDNLFLNSGRVISLDISDKTSNNFISGIINMYTMQISIKKGITLNQFGIHDLGTGFTTASAVANAAKQYQSDDTICDIPFFISPATVANTSQPVFGPSMTYLTASYSSTGDTKYFYPNETSWSKIVLHSQEGQFFWHTTETQTTAIDSSARFACVGMPRANWS